MNRLIIRRHRYWYTLLVAVLSLFAMAAAASIQEVRAAEHARAQGERLLTVYDRGQERVFLTTAGTVGEALERADIDVDETDTVEPSLDDELIASDYNVNVYRARPVVVVDGALRHKVMTSRQTPQQIADSAGVELHPEDNASLGMSSNILMSGASMELLIERATPITLILYGKSAEVRTQAETVADLLDEKDIKIGENDQLSVGLGQQISSGIEIEIWRDGKQTVTEEEDVPFEVEQIQDADREIGFREVKTPGQKGKRTVTYEIEMKNREEVSRKEIASVTTTQPKKQVEIVGVKPKNVFEGGLGEAMAKLRSCESGGNYANKNNPLYRGAYQFGYTTWGNYGGFYDPADAPPAVQDQAALELYQRRGWQPWPHCSQTLGLQDSYR